MIKEKIKTLRENIKENNVAESDKISSNFVKKL